MVFFLIQNWEKSIIVEKDPKEMSESEIEEQVSQLENDYAEKLQSHSGISVLSSLWNKIKELRNELYKRKQ